MMGQTLKVQWDDVHARLIDPRTSLLLREHLRQKPGRHRIAPEDLTQRTPKTVAVLLARAGSLGPNIGTLCVAIHKDDGEYAERRIRGMLNLSKKHGPVALEQSPKGLTQRIC
jgi:hypothetical protein